MANKNVHKTKCDYIVDEIISMIHEGVYKENETLPPESYFVEYFGVSRVTVRESFKKLNTLGIVNIQQGKGTTVNPINIGNVMQPLYAELLLKENSVQQVYDVRKILEVGGIKLAVGKISEDAMKELSELVAQMKSAYIQRDSALFSILDMKFHRKIIDCTGNEVLKSVYKCVSEEFKKYTEIMNLSMETVESSLGHHEKILEAISVNDVQSAVDYMEIHIDEIKKCIWKRIINGEMPRYIKV